MALYYDPNRLDFSASTAFHAYHAPGTPAPHAGIYRCTSCGEEVALAGGHKLPSQNHAQHDATQGAIRWQLIVRPQARA